LLNHFERNMAPRENGGNGGDDPKPERSIATLSTLR
jgi:hypothetical protein